ncbi:unnamed protein product [Discula destructiva]
MSRGGRGGGRGGRGGKKNLFPWEEDKNLKVNYAPLEAFPHYNVPIPSAITEREKAQVRNYLLFREQVHDGPLYTAARSDSAFALAGSTTPRAYGQEQINQRYGKKDKGTIDPFTAVDMPSSRMKRVERALPDLGARPFSMHLFPSELHATLNDEDHPGGPKKASNSSKKKTMKLSKITTLRTAKEIFNMSAEGEGGEGGETAEERQKKLLEQLERLDENAGEDAEDFDIDEEQNYEEEMDEAYDDDEGGDYDAENYFDGGDDDDMDDGGGDDGVY